MDEFKSAMVDKCDIGGLKCPCCNRTITTRNKAKPGQKKILRKIARAKLVAEARKCLATDYDNFKEVK